MRRVDALIAALERNTAAQDAQAEAADNLARALTEVAPLLRNVLGNARARAELENLNRLFALGPEQAEKRPRAKGAM